MNRKLLEKCLAWIECRRSVAIGFLCQSLWAAAAYGALAAGQPPLNPGADPGYRPDRILVKPKAGLDLQRLQRFHQGRGIGLLRQFSTLDNIQVLKLPPGAGVERMIAAYRESGLVEYAEPDFKLHPSRTPNDAKYADGSLWHLHNTGQHGGLADADIDAPETWESLTDAGDIIIAIVDTGIRSTHQDLAANMWVNPGEIAGNGIDDDQNGYVDDIHGINAVMNSGDPIDPIGHGTQAAGIAGAAGNNGTGITGVPWRIKIMACRFFDELENGSVSDAVQCIDYARAHGAQVINASFGSTGYSSTMYSAINQCREAGIIFVAAAGNTGTDNDSEPVYPASYGLDNIVAVAATTRTDQLADYSNYGSFSVDLGAPGSAITTTHNAADDAYIVGSGTSYAAPVVSGAFALMRARYQQESYKEIIDRLLAATDPLSDLAGSTVSGGRLNLAKALGPSISADFTAAPTAGEAPMTVDFTDTSFGTITDWLWDFGDGTTASQQNPSHTYPSEGRYTATLEVSNAAGETSRKSRAIDVVANYEISKGTFNWIDPSGMSEVTLDSEGISAPQALPFAFTFYGQTRSQLYVSGNGLIGWKPQGLGSSSNTDLPQTGSPNDIIAPFWDGLEPGSGGSVRLGTVGEAPNRLLVVSWLNVPHRQKPPANYTFQAVLEEGSNDIRFQYLKVDPKRPNDGALGQSATVGLEHASGRVAAKYSYNGGTLLSDNQAILFTPTSAGGMSVSPASDFAVSGTVGGPFSPSNQSYAIRNTGGADVNWTVSATQDWIGLSNTSGTLAPGEEAEITVTINADADLLSAGSYRDTLEFVNMDNGIGNTTRSVTLSVNGTKGVLSVNPADGLDSTGTVGGPFNPGNEIYTLVNSGDAALEWSANKDQPWFTLSSGNGSLGAGESTTVTVGVNSEANLLAAGEYTDTVEFLNLTNGEGDTTRAVNLTVESAPGVLAVSPETGFSSSGLTGGPFSPESQTYTLTNTGGTTLEWTAGKNAEWLDLSSAAGTLAPGETATLTVNINAQANQLVPGTYDGGVEFNHVTTGDQSILLTFQLDVLSALWLTPEGPNAGGEFQFTLEANPDRTYVIESSTNLLDWMPVSTNTTDSTGSLTYTDENSSGSTTRFYRAVRP